MAIILAFIYLLFGFEHSKHHYASTSMYIKNAFECELSMKQQVVVCDSCVHNVDTRTC